MTTAWIDHLRQDFRYAVRGLRRSPGFTATVVLTLGLGIGANAAMFGVIDRLMLRPFPYLRDPGSVNRVYLQWSDRGRARTNSGFEYTRFLDLRKWTASFSQSAGVTEAVLAVGSGASVRERLVGVVSASFFDFFDAPPVLGRYFTAAEDVVPRGAAVVVLGYAFWQSEYGGRNVLGQTLQVRDVSSTIVGVAPRGFVGVSERDEPALYLPITTYAAAAGGPEDRVTYYTQYHWGWMGMMVRRRPGVSVEAASRDLSNAHVQSWNAELALDPAITPVALARPHAVAGSLKTAAGPDAGLESRTLLWVMGVAVIVLLIACANVTNLLVARVLRRRREIAVRVALGVSRARLLGQALTESLLLAGVGCLAGIVIAQWGGAALRGLFVRDGAALAVVTDWRTLGVAAACAGAAAILTAFGPALVAVRGDLSASLKAGAREGTHQRSRVRSGLLVVQGTLSVILLVGAGLFVRSLRNVRDMRMGYDVDPILLVGRNLRGMQLDDDAQVALGRRLLETAQALPEVERAAWVSSVPFRSTSSTSLVVPGIDSTARLGRFTYQTATPDYFEAIGTRIIRGRGFTGADRAGAPRVAVVSAAMARVLWPGREPLGQCMHVGGDTMPCSTVIGVAEDAVQNSLTDDARLRYYLPIDQFRPARGFALVLRVRGDPARVAEPIRAALQRVMPGESYVTTQVFGNLVDRQRRSWHIGATMFAAFGALALLVAAVGLYGVVTYDVAQRMHELGVRVALGARAHHIVRLVVGQGIRLAALGVTLGVMVALLAARWVQPLLFQESARDPAIYGLVAVVLIAVAVVASTFPALRATRADPNAALRSE